ncbi:hypothetical protein [Paenibacillus chitinolyticus]|uniref:hypothetical protein n=1 Tax=Paenibacillus chitinolyticus TaxID=79263 RepID=UPI00295EA038|nr:hypothetical protein [Paenibacillus chitinolyticus]
MRRQQKAKEECKKAKVRQATTIKAKKVSVEKERQRMSESAKWKQKRHERYNQIVWKGWRTSEPAGKIVKYNINDNPK